MKSSRLGGGWLSIWQKQLSMAAKAQCLKTTAVQTGTPTALVCLGLRGFPGCGASRGLRRWLRGNERKGNSLQCSCLGNPTDREAWQAAVHGVSKESDTT